MDLESQQAFADALRGLVDRGATVVLVAHELGPMADLVDRAIVMRDGRVAYDGPPLASFTEADHARPPPPRPGPTGRVALPRRHARRSTAAPRR